MPVEPSTTYKICKTCGQNKPLTEFYYDKRKDWFRAECKICKRKQAKTWAEEHPQQRRENLREYYNQNWFRWASYSNPEQARNNRRTYRARKVGAPGRIFPEIVAALRSGQDDKCAYCECSLDGGGHLDHMIPLSRGGSNFPANLQLLCPTCNWRKHTKTHEEFLAELGDKNGLDRRNQIQCA